MKTSPGNHGNLVGGGGMDAGDVITIPTAIGRWKTVMVPVPSVESKLLQVGGALGVVVVVLEEDETPHAAAAAGHKAFNEAMQRELDALFPTFTIMDPTPTPDQLHELEDKISTAIHDAIEKKVNIGQWIAGWFGGGQDDKIGTFTRIWTHGDLEDAITEGPVDIYDVGRPPVPADRRSPAGRGGRHLHPHRRPADGEEVHAHARARPVGAAEEEAAQGSRSRRPGAAQARCSGQEGPESAQLRCVRRNPVAERHGGRSHARGLRPGNAPRLRSVHSTAGCEDMLAAPIAGCRMVGSRGHC